MINKSKQSAFTTVELLVTLFIAALFLTSGFQLYSVIVKNSGDVKAKNSASVVIQEYLKKYKSQVANKCVVITPKSNESVTVEGLSNAHITVSVTCPYGTDSKISKVEVSLSYGTPDKTAETTCPTGFIKVPGSATYGTSDFCVMKYEAKKSSDTVPVSTASGIPWGAVSQNDAIEYSKNVAGCKTCHLTTEAEWMTLAQNVLLVSNNWISGTVGSGNMYTGHSDGSPAGPIAASTNDSDGYYGTGQTTGDQRRTMKLSNGETIWDLAGNYYEMTSDKISGGTPGITGESTGSWKTWSAVTAPGSLKINVSPQFAAPAANSWSGVMSSTAIYSNSSNTNVSAFIHGGSWGNSTSSNVFMVWMTNTPYAASSNSYEGFRVASEPINPTTKYVTDSALVRSSVDCPTGFILVPGSDTYGTNNFCIMKYEAKQSGPTTPISQATGTPWVSITPNDAAIYSKNVVGCINCHLITEAEWMTIAQNVLSNPVNWSNGIVGSGYIYSGHNDGVPAFSLSASNDNDGYAGTGAGSSSNQKRTLTLTNGEVVWDLAGNVYEWTEGQMTGGQPGITGESGFVWKEWTAALTSYGTFAVNPYPSSTGITGSNTWNSSKGIGQLYSYLTYSILSNYARSGSYLNNTGAGVLTLTLDASPSAASVVHAGFRVAK